MDDLDVGTIVLKLLAAFPRDRVEESTLAVYVESLSDLRNVACLLSVVNTMIRNDDRLPTIARIRASYNASLDRFLPKTIEEGPITEGRRLENLQRLSVLRDAVGLKSVVSEEAV